MMIRGEVAQRSETLHDIQGRVSAYNKKQSAIADVRKESWIDCRMKIC